MIVVVLPAYNEALCIGDLLTSFAEAIADEGKTCRLIVVNDGSSDETGEVVGGFSDRIPLELINHPQNRGLAEAIKTGTRRIAYECRPSSFTAPVTAQKTPHGWCA